MASSEKVRKAINSGLKIRWILITSWIFSLQALVCALVVYFSGDLRKGDSKALTFITFNTSSLGLSSYRNHSSPLHENITALVPSEIENPVSITQYLGVHDWYSMSYLWTCSGLYQNSSEYYNASDIPLFLTNHIRNIECDRQPGNYKFSLRERLKRGLKPSVQELAEDIPDKTFYPLCWIWTWLVGLVFTFLAFAVLPWTFARETYMGKGHWSLIPTLFTLVAFSLFLITACLESPNLLKAESSNIGTPSFPFIGLTIVSITSMLVSFCLGILGWGVGVWLEGSLPLKQPNMENGNDQNDAPSRTVLTSLSDGRGEV